jgi:hypothetical protein
MEKTNKQRPELPKTLLDNLQTEAEDFQNRVLRPIIKMQSDLLIAHVNSKLESLSVHFSTLTNVEQTHYLTQLFMKDIAFKREVIGMILGYLTLDEYRTYASLTKELNRRIVQIILQRATDILI